MGTSNPDSMRVTRHLPDKHILFDYTLHQQKLEQVQSAKYLGITITDNLAWGQHVSEISCKATKTMGFLQRNLALAPRHTKEVAYKTLVQPQLVQHLFGIPVTNFRFKIHFSCSCLAVKIMSIVPLSFLNPH